MDNSKIIKEPNEEQKGGDVMTKEHFVTTSTMHKDDCVYDVKIASVSKDMCNGKRISMVVLCQYFGHKKSNFFMLHF